MNTGSRAIPVRNNNELVKPHLKPNTFYTFTKDPGNNNKMNCKAKIIDVFPTSVTMMYYSSETEADKDCTCRTMPIKWITNPIPTIEYEIARELATIFHSIPSVPY